MPRRRWGLFPRIRHFRGHGIHSPFVYRFARQVLGKGWLTGEQWLYSSFTAKKIDKKTARQLHNLAAFLGEDVRVVLPDERLEDGEGTTAVLYPYRDRQKLALCLDAAAKKDRLTIDTRRFFVIFGKGREPKQHFKL